MTGITGVPADLSSIEGMEEVTEPERFYLKELDVVIGRAREAFGDLPNVPFEATGSHWMVGRTEFLQVCCAYLTIVARMRRNPVVILDTFHDQLGVPQLVIMLCDIVTRCEESIDEGPVRWLLNSMDFMRQHIVQVQEHLAAVADNSPDAVERFAEDVGPVTKIVKPILSASESVPSAPNAVPSDPSPALPKRPRADSAECLTGRPTVPSVALPVGELRGKYQSITEQVMKPLLAEYDTGKASRRMLIELCAHSYADLTLHLGLLRSYETHEQSVSPKNARVLERLQKLVDQAGKRILTTVELLERPDYKSVKLSISNAANVSVANQAVVQQKNDRAADGLPNDFDKEKPSASCGELLETRPGAIGVEGRRRRMRRRGRR